MKEFVEMLNIPPYDLILGHERADVLLEVLPDGATASREGTHDVACCLVCIRPNRKAKKRCPVWFWWELSKQDLEEGEEVGVVGKGGAGEWVVDCVMPDFDDLEFETESLSIQEFDDDDDDGEVTFFWDLGF